jgi:hypothetical protein
VRPCIDACVPRARDKRAPNTLNPQYPKTKNREPQYRADGSCRPLALPPPLHAPQSQKRSAPATAAPGKDAGTAAAPADAKPAEAPPAEGAPAEPAAGEEAAVKAEVKEEPASDAAPQQDQGAADAPAAVKAEEPPSKAQVEDAAQCDEPQVQGAEGAAAAEEAPAAEGQEPEACGELDGEPAEILRAEYAPIRKVQDAFLRVLYVASLPPVSPGRASPQEAYASAGPRLVCAPSRDVASLPPMRGTCRGFGRCSVAGGGWRVSQVGTACARVVGALGGGGQGADAAVVVL